MTDDIKAHQDRQSGRTSKEWQRMDRRTFIATSVAAGSIALINEQTCAGSRTIAPVVTTIDGNLVAPIDAVSPMDAATRAQCRSSGLTAFKQTLGGSGNRSKAATDREIVEFYKAVGLNTDTFTIVENVAALAHPPADGRIGLIPSFEAAEMLEGEVDNIDHFRRSGVLVMGLSYNRTTPFGSGVLSAPATGLTSLGHQAVERMNRLGVTVDISHSDEKSSFGAIRASTKPVLITHAGCAAVRPHPRNKSDTLLKALANTGGVIGIYELSFLALPPRQPNIEDYIFHLSHALNVCGEDHVGIGSDAGLAPFDTSASSMRDWDADIARRKAAGVSAPGEGPPPFVIGLNRPDRYAVIAAGLKQRGYKAGTVDKVIGANFQRVFADTWL